MKFGKHPFYNPYHINLQSIIYTESWKYYSQIEEVRPPFFI